MYDRMRRLVAAGLLPERAGQPVKVWAHVSLAELRALDDGSVLAQEWVGEMAVRWAGRRAAASQAGGDGAAWLDGKAASAVSCDATVIPVVTGQVDPAALDRLVALCLQFAGHGPHCAAGRPGPAGDLPGHTPDGREAASQPENPDLAAQVSQPDDPDAADRPGQPDDLSVGDGPSPPGPRPPTPQAQEMLRHAIIRTAVDLVSGPGGLASFLRAGLLGARLAGPSLPLDVGHSAEIPAAIRRAVILRDQHCRWTGGYFL
jgi:hypothetical protein